MISPFLKRLSAALMLVATVAGYSAAEVKAPYTWDFSEEIDTSDHAFKVGSNWGHIVGSYDYYGTLYYMTYSYETGSGVDGSGCLKASAQDNVSDYSWNTYPVTDVLVTPRVLGDVKIKVKKEYTYSTTPYIEIYEINDDGTLGSLMKSLRGYNIGDSDDVWYDIEIATGVADYKRFGLKCQNIYIDDFSATAADLVKEPGLKFASVSPSSDIRWNQQPDGKVKVDFRVTVTNNGELDLTRGMDNYSVTLLNTDNSAAHEIVTVPVPEDLTVGSTSGEFSVSAELDANLWSSTYSGVQLALRENISDTWFTPAQSYYTAYEPVFVFREEGSDATYSVYGPVSFGFVSEDKSIAYEIYNDGTAPLTVRSVTAPAGFRTDAPAGEFTVAAKEKKAVTVTLPAGATGAFEGELRIVWLDGTGAERTYTLALQGNVIDADTWVCDFGTDTGVYPEGSVADTGIGLKNGGTDFYYLSGSASGAEFITPLLHAEQGQSLSFSAGADGYSSWSQPSIEVYLSKDRIDWGEALVTLKGELSSQWTSASVTAPEAGDYYVKFVMPNGKIDNLCGFSKVVREHDLYFKEVDCPETVQSGEEVTFRVTVMAPLQASAADYTVSVMNGDIKVTEIPSQDLAADAKAVSEWSVKIKPTVEKTAVWNLYVKAVFADGTEFVSKTRRMTIENQPDFVFFDAGTPVYDYKPADRTEAIDFGRINTPGASMEFEIYNWGSAPLEVTSVTLPEGFEANIGNATVDSKQRQPLTVTVSAETAGSYSGELVIVYKNVDGSAEEFKLPVSVTLLDPAKWHQTFTGKGYEMTWPDGTIHGSNLKGDKEYSDNIWYVTNSSSYDTAPDANMFISPLLHAEAGETIEITAMKGSSYYGNSVLKVYAAPTREALIASESDDPELAATRRLIATVSADAADVDLLATSEWKTFRVDMDRAGDCYLGLQLIESMRVSELYGYTLVKKEHELVMKGCDIPATAMQNVPAGMSIHVHNYALRAETPETYSLTAIVDGEEIAVVPTAEIPVNTSFDDAVTAVPVAVRYHTAGTFPVQLRLSVSGQTLTTEAKDVTFAEEVALADRQVGEVANVNGQYAPLRFNDKNSESVVLFNAAALGLNPGDRIGAISFKGYSDETYKRPSFKLKAYYEWTDDQTQAEPQGGMYDVSGMTPVIDDEIPREWIAVQGTPDNTVALVTIDFDEPLVYEAGKSLRIVMSHNEANDYFSSYGFEQTGVDGNAYYHSSDYASSFSAGYWSSCNMPVMHLSLVVETATVSGNVTDGGVAVENAVVTCVSADGENVRYTATTDAQGNYSMNVIQNQRIYDLTVTAAGKEDFADGLTFGSSVEGLDFALADVVTIDNISGTEPGDRTGAVVKFGLALPEGPHAVILPFDLTADEVEATFGEGAEAASFMSSTLNGTALHLDFIPAVTEGDVLMKAGKPYLVNVTAATRPVRFRAKDVASGIDPDRDANAEFDGTYISKPVIQGMFLLEEGTFMPVGADTRAASAVQPYSAFIRSLDPAVTSISYSVGMTSRTEEIQVVPAETEDVIFNLQGIRVRNPQSGIYIVNGKKVYIHK